MDPDISIEADGWSSLPGLEALAQRAVKAALAELDLAGSLVALNFADDETVAAVNSQWRGKPKPTNVLSFPAPEGMEEPEGPEFLGDVILACGVTRAEAEEQGKPWANHVAHLIIHGVMHLSGHDHETEPDAAAMEAAEIRALARLGISNPYEIG